MTTPIVDEHLPDSRLKYGYEVSVSGKTLIDRTNNVQIRYASRSHSYSSVLAHAECCPPYNTFDCRHYNKTCP